LSSRSTAFPFNVNLGVDTQYKGRTIKGQRIDLLVDMEVPVEIKAVPAVPQVVTAQVLFYLKATGQGRSGD
jgi:GxxExxY protein